MSEIVKLNETIEALSKSLYDFQKKHTEDYVKDKAVMEEAVNKMTENLADLMQEKQDLEARIKFLESQEKTIQKNTENMTPEQKELQKHFGDFLRRNNRDPINFSSYLQLNGVTKAISIDSDVDGGFFVMPEYLGIMEKRIFETSPIRQVADVRNTANESVIITVDNDEVNAGWVGEREERGETDTPTLDQIQIHLQEIYAKPHSTQRSLDDPGFKVESWLMKKIADKFSRMENDSFVNGNGAKRPRGFLTYPAWTGTSYQTKAIQQVASGVANALSDTNNNGADALIDLQGELKEGYQTNAVFGMHRKTFTTVAKFKTDDGEYLFNRDLAKEVGMAFNLLGKKVIFFNDMPLVSANSLSIVYGNFMDAYTIIEKPGINVLRDPFTEKPFVQFYTTKRIGGEVCNFEAIKILKTATSI